MAGLPAGSGGENRRESVGRLVGRSVRLAVVDATGRLGGEEVVVEARIWWWAGDEVAGSPVVGGSRIGAGGG